MPRSIRIINSMNTNTVGVRTDMTMQITKVRPRLEYAESRASQLTSMASSSAICSRSGFDAGD